MNHSVKGQATVVVPDNRDYNSPNCVMVAAINVQNSFCLNLDLFPIGIFCVANTVTFMLNFHCSQSQMKKQR